MYQGLEERFRTVAGLRTIMLGSPTGDLDLPALYTAYQSFERVLKNAPPASNITGMQHIYAVRLVIRWVDFQQAEMQLLSLLDAIPDSIDQDPRLGSRLTKGYAWCSDGVTGFVDIGGVTYRVVDYTVHAFEKREGT